jgi:hypothetical protein
MCVLIRCVYVACIATPSTPTLIPTSTQTQTRKKCKNGWCDKGYKVSVLLGKIDLGSVAEICSVWMGGVLRRDSELEDMRR